MATLIRSPDPTVERELTPRAVLSPYKHHSKDTPTGYTHFLKVKLPNCLHFLDLERWRQTGKDADYSDQSPGYGNSSVRSG